MGLAILGAMLAGLALPAQAEEQVQNDAFTAALTYGIFYSSLRLCPTTRELPNSEDLLNILQHVAVIQSDKPVSWVVNFAEMFTRRRAIELEGNTADTEKFCEESLALYSTQGNKFHHLELLDDDE